MNLIFSTLSVGEDNLRALSKLGLNNFYLIKTARRLKIKPSDVCDVVSCIIDKIERHDDIVYYDICESKFFKKETLFRGVWIYKNNVIPHRLIEVMKDENKRMVILDRLRMILTILNKFNSNSLL